MFKIVVILCIGHHAEFLKSWMSYWIWVISNVIYNYKFNQKLLRTFYWFQDHLEWCELLFQKHGMFLPSLPFRAKINFVASKCLKHKMSNNLIATITIIYIVWQFFLSKGRRARACLLKKEVITTQCIY